MFSSHSSVRQVFDIIKFTSIIFAKIGKLDLWTEEEDKKLFNLYREIGAQWSMMAKEFKGRSAAHLKNRFYSTLRRVAIKKKMHGKLITPELLQSKDFLVQFVDDASEFGHNCISKRGRKKKNPFEIRQVIQKTFEKSIERIFPLPSLVCFNDNKFSLVNSGFPLNPLPSIGIFGHLLSEDYSNTSYKTAYKKL